MKSDELRETGDDLTREIEAIRRRLQVEGTQLEHARKHSARMRESLWRLQQVLRQKRVRAEEGPPTE
ncbi:MAG: hypothetical protein ACK47B_17120 [Armatimonadota bacterium]